MIQKKRLNLKTRIKFLKLKKLLGKIKSLFLRWKEKHKLSLVHDSTFQEKWSLKLSINGLISLVLFFIILIIASTFLIIRFTPVKSFIVDDIDILELNMQIDKNKKTIDSLSNKINANDNYLENLKFILNDGDFNDSIYKEEVNGLPENFQPDFSKNEADSLLRFKMEKHSDENFIKENQSELAFFLNPVEGIVSKSFNKAKGHYGLDIVSQKDEPIKSTLDGYVIFSGWTVNEGNVIIIQHENNFISSYKHCSVLFKKTGERVFTGDPIGLVGDSGEYTDGPHLHFEIWQNGVPLNPQEYLSY